MNFYEDKINNMKQGCLNIEDNQKVEILAENIDDLIKNQNKSKPLFDIY